MVHGARVLATEMLRVLQNQLLIVGWDAFVAL